MAFQDFLIGALVLIVGALFCFAGYQILQDSDNHLGLFCRVQSRYGGYDCSL